MILRDEIVRRLLVGKQLLQTAGTPVTPEADAIAIAKLVLTAHDAAELILAAVVDHLGIRTSGERVYLMDFVARIEEDVARKPVPGGSFFRNLNSVRRSFKHEGLLPNSREWHRVIENAWTHLDESSMKYLETTLDDIDLTMLLRDPSVRDRCVTARQLIREGKVKEALEQIGVALYATLEAIPGLRAPTLGERDTHQAMMLTAFGIRPSDFLSLQEFVPQVTKHEETYSTTWRTRGTGHLGNWTPRNANFCLETVIDVALKTQHTPWHPSAVDFYVLYHDVITARL